MDQNIKQPFIPAETPAQSPGFSAGKPSRTKSQRQFKRDLSAHQKEMRLFIIVLAILAVAAFIGLLFLVNTLPYQTSKP